MKEIIKGVLRKISFIKPLVEFIAQIECCIARNWVSNAHKRLMAIQWYLAPQPEHFDHHIDLFHSWLATRNSLWIERGSFGSLCLLGGDLLELSCGDGFNTRNFYSLRSKQIIACDYDPKAIQTAKKKNSAKNIQYVLADIRTDMPAGKFKNIVWDAAIEHFTPTEIEKILRDIKSRLTDEGIVSGYTIVERPDGLKSLSHHENEFKNKEDLLHFLTPHFKNVSVFETMYPNRHNLYFAASNGNLPFRNGWPYWTNEIKSKSSN